jgi:hypothetical protein
VAKRVYVKGVRNATTDNDRLVLAYLMLARALVEQEERESQETTDKPEPAE